MGTVRNVAEARLAIAQLSSHFQIPAPEVWPGRAPTSRYWFKKRLMVLSVNDWHGLPTAMLHEFTHHLLNLRIGVHRHDRQFYLTLKEVISAFGLPLADYPWATEYYGIYAFARAEGLTTKRWFKHERREVVAANSSPLPAVGARVRFAGKGAIRTGRVTTTRAGCRVRVTVDGDAPGRYWMVPASHLEVL